MEPPTAPILKGVHAEDVRQFWERANAIANEESRAPGKIEGGRWVRIVNLTSDVGKGLNGKVGQVLNETPTNNKNEGRYPILIDGQKKAKLIKQENFENIQLDEMVQTCRIASKGESSVGFFIDTLLFPKDHSMFHQCNPNGNSRVMMHCGLNLMVQRVKPYIPLNERVDYDNQWATFLMINPNDGFAPMDWQSYVGPVLVYRPGGLDCNVDDMTVVNDYLNELLDVFADEGQKETRKWINKEFFQSFARRNQSDHEENGCFLNLHIIDRAI